jgi:hypothetical protein
MTKQEAKDKMLAILVGSEKDVRKALQRRFHGGEGCLLERVFPRWPFDDAACRLFGQASLVYVPNDNFVTGKITLAQFRSAIEAL